MGGLPRRLIAVPLVALLLAAGCGDSDPDATVEGATAADEELGAAIVAELDEYNDSFDLSSLPPDQQAELAPIVDNLPPAGGGVKALSIADGVVEASTDFAADAEGAQTGQLICGAIYRSVDVATDPGGHRVLGEGGAVLADCRPRDANFP